MIGVLNMQLNVVRSMAVGDRRDAFDLGAAKSITNYMLSRCLNLDSSQYSANEENMRAPKYSWMPSAPGSVVSTMESRESGSTTSSMRRE